MHLAVPENVRLLPLTTTLASILPQVFVHSRQWIDEQYQSWLRNVRGGSRDAHVDLENAAEEGRLLEEIVVRFNAVHVLDGVRADVTG